MGTYHRPTAIVPSAHAQEAAAELSLPESVVISLVDLAGVAKEGLLALAVGTGLETLHVLLDESVTVLAGPKGKHNPERAAVRHGSEAGSVTLGGRRVHVRRPRVRSADGRAEVAVPAYDFFASRYQLSQMAVERMLARLSTRRYRSGLEPVGSGVEAEATGTSKSAVSRRFVALTRKALEELMSQRLDDLDLLVLMIDGVQVAEHLCVVALGIDAEGRKHPLGIIEGATENGTVVTHLLEDLVSRGLDASRGLLVVIDGSKALAAAVRKVLGAQALVHRCQEHKIRNVKGHLPEARQAFVERKMRAAYHLRDARRAEADLKALAGLLEEDHPGAAASLREGLPETLTVMRLELSPTLTRTLRSTNPIESMIGRGRDVARNVKRYRSGEMAPRWTAAGMGEAQKSFRRVQGFRDLPILRAALEHHVHAAVDKNRRVA